MNVQFNNRKLIFLLPALLSVATGIFGQGVTKAYTYTTAYSALNAGTTASPPVTYVGNASTGIKVIGTSPSLGYLGPLDKKWNISLGIPTQVFLDHFYLKGEMEVAYENNPDLYWSGTPEFQSAVDFLLYTDFAPISSWAPVRCTVTFRFIPPVLGDNYDLKYDYRNNPSAAPDRGNVTFWIR